LFLQEVDGGCKHASKPHPSFFFVYGRPWSVGLAWPHTLSFHSLHYYPQPIFLSSCKDPRAKDPAFTELGEPDEEGEGRAAVVLPCTRMLRYFLLAILFFVSGEFWVLSFRKDVESRLRKVVFCFRSFWKQICCVCVCVCSFCDVGC
jgi:hypothetical protein